MLLVIFRVENQIVLGFPKFAYTRDGEEGISFFYTIKPSLKKKKIQHYFIK